VANIFLGNIKKWNDPAIAALNPGVSLPNQDIIVVHRSDGSGTTYIFTDYLSNVSPDWKAKVGNATSVSWPVGLGGKGNDGVAGSMGSDGTIGYLELAYAATNKIAIASLVNKSGKAIAATIDSTSSAMADFAGQMPASLHLSIVNAPGAASYPIAGYTYFLFYTDVSSDCTKAQKLVQFANWALSSAGSKFATDLLYVPLPDAIHTQVATKLSTLTCGGGKSIPK
jgi:phosphate transport system substrate-binding protein